MWMPDRRLDFMAKGVALALALLVGGLLLWWVGDVTSNTGPLPRPDFGWPEFWLNRYQTFIAGMIALAATLTAGYWALKGARGQMAEQRRAADLGLKGVREQIEHNERSHREQHGREVTAARAVLAHALSAVTNYSRRCMTELAREGQKLEDPQRARSFRQPILPSEVIVALQSAVRFASDPERADAVAKVLFWLQIQISRLEHLADDLNNENKTVLLFEVQSRIIDAAEVHTLTSRLFHYARGTDEHGWRPNVSMEDVRSALHTTGIWEDGYPSLFGFNRGQGASRAAWPRLR
jgi:hypothetical protein